MQGGGPRRDGETLEHAEVSQLESGFSKWAPLSIRAKLSGTLIKNADLWAWAQTHLMRISGVAPGDVHF